MAYGVSNKEVAQSTADAPNVRRSPVGGEVRVMADVEGFLNRVLEWAQRDGDVLAVGLAGSHARAEGTEASDIDLIVLLQDPESYVSDTGWAHRFGDVSRQRIEDWGLVTSVRVWYLDGPEVEYGLADATWAAMPLDDGTRRVAADGLRVLFEREPLLSRCVVAARPAQQAHPADSG
jgi:predicted nucleotidyltransferase